MTSACGGSPRRTPPRCGPGPTVTDPVKVRGTRPAAPAPPRPSLEPLTRRETEIARLVARGETAARVAAALFLTAGTVKNLAGVQRRTGTANRVGVAAWVWSPD